MKKMKSRWLRITGKFSSVVGVVLLGQPLIRAIFGQELVFSFFGLFTGNAAMLISIIFLVLGIGIVTFTEPLNEEKHKQ